jgi:hypothetical protein
MLEVNIGGVFFPIQLLWACTAFFLSSLISRLLSRTAFYSLIWHRALFDLSLFVIFWAAIAAIPYHVAFSNVGLR